MKRKPAKIQSNEVQMTNEQGEPTPELLSSFPDTSKGRRDKQTTLKQIAAAQKKPQKSPATKKAPTGKKPSRAKKTGAEPTFAAKKRSRS